MINLCVSAGYCRILAGLPVVNLDLSETEKEVFELINEKTTRKEIELKLNLPERTTRDILKKLQDKKLIEKVGKGPATYYKKR